MRIVNFLFRLIAMPALFILLVVMLVAGLCVFALWPLMFSKRKVFITNSYPQFDFRSVTIRNNEKNH